MARMALIIMVLIALFLAYIPSDTPAAVEPPPPPSILSPVFDITDLPVSSYFINLNSVAFIRCGNYVGSGAIISRGLVMTASHVLGDEKSCIIGNQVANIVENHPDLDFAILKIDTGEAQRFPLDCRGFVEGHPYYAIGFAAGQVFAVTKLEAELRATTTRTTGTFEVRQLSGRSYQGMSGGPLISADGDMVGILLSISVFGPAHTQALELKDTSVCATNDK